jgi:hypothetical protein
MREVSERNLYKYLYLLFFIWPVLGLIYTYKYINTKAGKSFYVFFFALIGFTYTIGNTGYDTYAYYTWFQEQSLLSFGDYFSEIIRRFSIRSFKPEIFQYSVEFWVSRVTNSSNVYFCVLSTILGVAIVKNLTILTDLYNRNKTLYGLLFIIFLIVLVSPLRIASFRHYFASLVFIYSAYQVIIHKDKRYLFGIISTIFIHIGFSIGILLFFLYYLIGNRILVYLALVGLSYQLSDSLISTIIENTDFFSGDFKTKAAAYSYEGFIKETQKAQKEGIFLLRIFVEWTRYYFLVFTVFWYVKIKNMDEGSKGLFFLSLIFFSFTILTQDIIAISNRFSVVYFMLCCVYFIRVFSVYIPKKNFIFTVCTIFILSINFLVIGRQTAEFINASFLLPLLPVQLFVDSELLILDILDFFRS